MKQSILLFSFLLIITSLTAQTQFPKYSIGTDVSSILEYQPTVWFNSKFFKELPKELKYQSFIFDVGYVVGESKIYGKALDRNKISFKLRAGTNIYKKKRENFWTYQGLLLTFKSIHYSKVGDFFEAWDPWNGGTINSTMLRESTLIQYSIQYNNGFEWFINKRCSLEGSYHLGVKYKNFQLLRGIESTEPYYQRDPFGLYALRLNTYHYEEPLKNSHYAAIDIDLALKLNYLLY